MFLEPQHAITAGEVHVWHLLEEDLGDDVPLEAMQAIVASSELARMRRFSQARDRTLFLLSRVLTRTVLASYLGCRCDELQFATTTFGKPILESGANLNFNLSHSRGGAALAVSQHEVGVDIEERSRSVDYLGLAERYFAADEARHLASLPEEQRAAAFFAIWTLKEAYVKGIGRGLTFPLDAFAFELEVSRLLRFQALADFVASDWHFHQFDLGPRHCGAIAVQTGDAAVTLRSWKNAFFDG
jgi:4'-phosphopantetheinyl transferase